MELIFGIIIILLVFETLGKKIKKTISKEVSASEFVSQLEKFGYFKYAEKKHIENIKNSFIKDYDPTNELVPSWDEDTGVPLEYRYYWCDGETVYEGGGFTELLERVKPTFEKIGLTIKVTNHFEEWDSKNKWLNHRITINRTKYVIFKNFKGYGWGEAVMRFAQIINQEAEKHNIEEKIYLASGGNDGRLIFLTKELYDYIDSVYKNKQWKPLEVYKWMKVMNVKPMKLN